MTDSNGSARKLRSAAWFSGLNMFTFSRPQAWNNLNIANNIINVGAGTNENVIGIAENTGSINSIINITNNSVTEASPAFHSNNKIVAYGMTSESSAGFAVTYSGNSATGVNEGLEELVRHYEHYHKTACLLAEKLLAFHNPASLMDIVMNASPSFTSSKH